MNFTLHNGYVHVIVARFSNDFFLQFHLHSLIISEKKDVEEPY